ncbi:MAG: UDP-N-acetylglucosamine 1-carboxyvinyltransferase [Defluviitaleaceae bacterium]|nr:UDP-N-acetylglucosamine 1-carboxyvinyltransferase [Defluviitaleaceae bacterium]MCL2836212.1 UDP-N-acetylglucosamine 1-carboxyvinyltransferase [Defluviitaleaceae bacterium]
MSRLIIEESPPLAGRVRVGGSKNAALPIMAAALMARGKCVIHDVPALSDIFVMQNIIESYGGATEYDCKSERMIIDASELGRHTADYELISKIRASFLILGPLLSRLGEVKTAMPGGCAIGGRPVDLHLKGMAALGAQIGLNHGYIEASAAKLRGAEVHLDFPSVGATENIIMAATLAKGRTIIGNCALEPEITDLCNFLVSIGADISGAGTDTITVNGVDSLNGGEYRIIPDRIEAGTFLAAACARPGGDVSLENADTAHLRPVIAKLREMGAQIEEKSGPGLLSIKTDDRLKAADVKTLPYPGFPTDMQAQFMALLAVSTGRGVMTETVFENRYMHAAEMSRMGACIKIDSRTAVVDGVRNLAGCPVKATDLRAGAALIIAALGADGVTEIFGVHHLERGYDRIDEKLRQLGARIIKIG